MAMRYRSYRILYSITVQYLMRIPGDGTDQFIDIKREAHIYHTLEGRGICNYPISLNSRNGSKITQYLEGVRTCALSESVMT